MGGEFQVNTYTSGNQVSPSVGMDSSGNFVIAWHSVDQGGTFKLVWRCRWVQWEISDRFYGTPLVSFARLLYCKTCHVLPVLFGLLDNIRFAVLTLGLDWKAFLPHNEAEAETANIRLATSRGRSSDDRRK